MQVYIHIGYPKTGSSAIQSHIFTNQGWFEERGIYIPRTGYTSGRGHARLINGDLKRLCLPSEMELPAEVRLQELSAELATRADEGVETALISWEGLAVISPHTIAKLHTALIEHDVTIVCYVRDQIALYQAAALKLLEIQGYVSVRSFFEPQQIENDELDLYDFTQVLTHWRDAFEGKAQLRVRLFERDCLTGSDVILDFLACLGVDIDANFALQSRMVNSTLDSRAAAVLLLSRATRAPQTERTRLIAALLNVAGNSEDNVKDYLPASTRQQISDYFRASNKKLLEIFRPENLPTDASELFVDSLAGKNSPVFEYLRSVFLALDTPTPQVWDGGVLEGHQVAELTRPPGSGWRGNEETGVWSLGPISKLAFLLPDTNRNSGPKAIALHFVGDYFKGHSQTKLILNRTEHVLDLRDTEVLAPIDAATAEAGVTVELQHLFPAEKAGEKKETAGLAYKLQQISYRFVWE